MRRISKIFLAMFFVYTITSSQNHLPIPHTEPHGSTKICWGYAMGMAGGKGEDDETCSPTTMIPNDNSIASEYFVQYEWSELNSRPLQPGDILYWPGDHAMYVSGISYFEGGNIVVDSIFVYHMSANGWTGVKRESLYFAKNRAGVGNPSYFCRRKSISITVSNSYGAGNITVGTTSVASGNSTSVNWWSTVTLTATSTNYLNVWRQWNTWQKGLEDPEEQNPWSIVPESGKTYKANFINQSDISFSNSFPGASGGTMTVRDTLRDAPGTVRMPQNTTFNIAASSSTTINGIWYTFSQWSGASTSSNPSLTSQSASEHKTYTANYTAKPLPPTGVSAGGSVNDPVHITWTDNPNANVSQYQIWRRVKPLGGAQGDPEHIATVNKEVEEYDDNEYIITSSYTDDLLTYDVRSYYSVNGTYSDQNWNGTAFGQSTKMAETPQAISMTAEELPTEFAVSNYPNPFNPSTTINYQLVEDASVALTVYDMMGREIVTLLRGEKSAGYYSVQWNGRNAENNTVASGVYFYRFSALPASGERHIIRSGKLILSK